MLVNIGLYKQFFNTSNKFNALDWLLTLTEQLTDSSSTTKTIERLIYNWSERSACVQPAEQLRYFW